MSFSRNPGPYCRAPGSPLRGRTALRVQSSQKIIVWAAVFSDPAPIHWLIVRCGLWNLRQYFGLQCWFGMRKAQIIYLLKKPLQLRWQVQKYKHCVMWSAASIEIPWGTKFLTMSYETQKFFCFVLHDIVLFLFHICSVGSTSLFIDTLIFPDHREKTRWK